MLSKAKASGFKGYTAEEIEGEGKKDLQVLSEMLGEQQVGWILYSTYITTIVSFNAPWLLTPYSLLFSSSSEMNHTLWIWLHSATLRRS